MSKLIALVSAPATAMRLATITGTDGVRSISTIVLSGDEGVQPVMIPASLNPEKIEDLKAKLGSSPIIATVFAQNVVREKGVGVLQDGVSIQYISDEFPIMETQADGYERHNLQTGEVDIVQPTSPTLH